MKTSTFKNNWLTVGGLLLALPTAYFIIIVLLKFGLKIDGPFDAVQPSLEKWGIKETLGWNINLLILFGPVLAFLFTIFQVLKIEFHFTKEEFLLQFNLQKKWFPLLVAVLNAGLMAVLLIYALGENCNCS